MITPITKYNVSVQYNNIARKTKLNGVPSFSVEGEAINTKFPKTYYYPVSFTAKNVELFEQMAKAANIEELKKFRNNLRR